VVFPPGQRRNLCAAIIAAITCTAESCDQEPEHSKLNIPRLGSWGDQHLRFEITGSTGALGFPSVQKSDHNAAAGLLPAALR
jgi:hypothetical protein